MLIQLTRLLTALSLTSALVAPVHAQSSEAGKDIEVSAKKVADMVVIDVSFTVEATTKEAWDVLVDYDHMPDFLHNLKSSKVLSKSPTQLRVAQKGGVSHGPISLTFDVVRDVQLNPYSEIISHVISGNLKKVDGTTRLAAAGLSTKITFHSESISNVWVPPGIGPALIESETRDQFNDMRTEILRRKNAAVK